MGESFTEQGGALTREIISHSPKETEDCAARLAATLKAGDLVAFRGPMGAGKTAMIRGIARVFGVEEEVSSPTFAIMNVYQGTLTLHHYDMYRIGSWDDLYTTGFFDDLEDPRVLLLIEWSENIAEYLPDACYVVELSYGPSEDSRCISIKYPEKEKKPC